MAQEAEVLRKWAKAGTDPEDEDPDPVDGVIEPDEGEDDMDPALAVDDEEAQAVYGWLEANEPAFTAAAMALVESAKSTDEPEAEEGMDPSEDDEGGEGLHEDTDLEADVDLEVLGDEEGMGDEGGSEARSAFDSAQMTGAYPEMDPEEMVEVGDYIEMCADDGALCVARALYTGSPEKYEQWLDEHEGELAQAGETEAAEEPAVEAEGSQNPFDLGDKAKGEALSPEIAPPGAPPSVPEPEGEVHDEGVGGSSERNDLWAGERPGKLEGLSPEEAEQLLLWLHQHEPAIYQALVTLASEIAQDDWSGIEAAEELLTEAEQKLNPEYAPLNKSQTKRGSKNIAYHMRKAGHPSHGSPQWKQAVAVGISEARQARPSKSHGEE